MTSDYTQIFSYFSSNLEHLKNAKDQLSRLALNFYGPEGEANIRLACNETEFTAVEAKMKELVLEFEEQKRLETVLLSKHAEYLAVMNEARGNASADTSDARPSSEISQDDPGDALSADKGVAAAPVSNSITPEGNQQQFDDSVDVQLLTDEEFAEVPKYMKNRATVAQINVIVSKLNVILEKKYRILSMGMKGAISREAKDDYVKYKEQEVKELKGQRGCTESELRESLSSRDVTNLKLAIPILRHCRRVKDVRVGKVTYLVVL